MERKHLTITYVVDREGVKRTKAGLRQLVAEGRAFARSDDKEPLVVKEDEDRPADDPAESRLSNDGRAKE